MTFTSAARAVGGSGTILSASLTSSNAPALAGIFELWLFNASYTADNDNAAFTPTTAEMLTVVQVMLLGR
jgi:hypothetical protein